MTLRLIAAIDIETALGHPVILNGALTVSGAHPLTLTLTDTTNLTLPPSGSLLSALAPATVSLTLPATVGAQSSALLLTTAKPLLVCQVAADAGASPQNYSLTLYDGDPNVATQPVVYQATGITASPFADNAAFYIPAPSSNIYAQVTNIDAAGITAAITLRAIALS
jgi:hypothetical protein